MLIIPAIDLRGGRCVRLRQGRKSETKVYDGDPLERARSFVKEGAAWLHIVDLDAAFGEAESPNRAILRRIVEGCGVPVQTGGGIRSVEDAKDVLEAGAARVICGTLAVEQPDLFTELVQQFGSRVAVGIDARAGLVVTRGWETQAKIPAINLAHRVVRQGIERIIYTDIACDGMLEGVNLAQTRAVAEASGVPVTASGGVSSLIDIQTLSAVEFCGIDSVIVGKALYDGRFTLEEALAAV